VADKFTSTVPSAIKAVNGALSDIRKYKGMKIKVTKCSVVTYWYRNHIDRVLEVIDPDKSTAVYPDAYLVYIDKNTDTRGWIKKQDCEDIDTTLQPTDIERYFNDKGKRITDDLGWLGEYHVSAKDIIDMIIDLKK
jgi:hypothetical protein